MTMASSINWISPLCSKELNTIRASPPNGAKATGQATGYSIDRISWPHCKRVRIRKAHKPHCARELQRVMSRAHRMTRPIRSPRQWLQNRCRHATRRPISCLRNSVIDVHDSRFAGPERSDRHPLDYCRMTGCSGQSMDSNTGLCHNVLTPMRDRRWLDSSHVAVVDFFSPRKRSWTRSNGWLIDESGKSGTDRSSVRPTWGLCSVHESRTVG